jgi:Na+/phosphate symporter
MITKNYFSHRKNTKALIEEDKLERAESSSTQGVILESAANIASVVKRGNRIYTGAINGLATHNLVLLKKNKKQIEKLSDEVDDLRDNIFYFIKNLEEPSLSASNFYLNIINYLQDMTQSLDYISRVSLKHVNNNHKRLKFSQIRELKDLDEHMENLFLNTHTAFKSHSFDKIADVLIEKDAILEIVKSKISIQVERTRNEESSPKNTTLYFGLLLETKDLLTSTMNLLEEYYSAHDSSVEPAKLIAQSDSADK